MKKGKFFMFFDTEKLFSAGLGYSQSGALLGQDYFYWNLDASWFVTSYLTFDARYVDVHPNEYSETEIHHGEFYPQALEKQISAVHHPGILEVLGGI